MAEIGVYEGKFFIGLAKTFSNPDHKAVAIDVFDMQEFNLDKAGIGKVDVLLENNKKNNVNIDSIEIKRADSLHLDRIDSSKFVSDFGKVKFFSVDGCHTVLHTTKDIEYAMAVTAPEGVIAVDDFLNPFWPGVVEAVTKMYLLNEYPFVPFLYVRNKLFLCSETKRETYMNAIYDYNKKHHPKDRLKFVTRYGYKTLSIKPDNQDTVLQVIEDANKS